MQIQKALVKDLGSVFVMDQDGPDGPGYGLVSSDLITIKPNYEAMIKGGTLKVTDIGVQQVGT